MRGPVFWRLFETPLLVRAVAPQAGLQEDVRVRACAHMHGLLRSRGIPRFGLRPSEVIQQRHRHKLDCIYHTT